MLEQIEQFTTKYEHTIAALGAFGTLAAVVTSLLLGYLAARSARTKLIAGLTQAIIIHDLIPKDNRPELLAVTITNTGNSALRIPFSFFRWKIPFAKKWALVSPLDSFAGHQWIPQKQYPIVIDPRESRDFYISDLATFRTETEKMFRHLPMVLRPLTRFMYARVRTDDNCHFRVRIDRLIKAELKRLRIKARH